MNENNKILTKALQVFGIKKLSKLLDKDIKTIKRWSDNTSPIPSMAVHAMELLIDRENQNKNPNYKNLGDFTFIDLFAGIGGIRLGFEAIGGKCVFTSEWDKFAQQTYSANFADEHPIFGDITKIDEKTLPDFDVLIGGFPCQPFSIAGVSKKNSLGVDHGFLDKTQGTLFFDVARIIAYKKPKAFLLENVKNLLSHDKGRTFEVIKDTLENKLGYQIFYKVIDGAHFTPQHRERIIIVGFKEDTDFTWNDLILPDKSTQQIKNILHKPGEKTEEPYTIGSRPDVSDKYTLTDKLWNYLQEYAAKHKAKGNGFGFGLVKEHNISRTLSARYHKDGSEILIYQGDNKNPRRLTPRECARLMGYPDTYKIVVSDTQAYKQFGNSVVVPVIYSVARIMKPHFMKIQ